MGPITSLTDEALLRSAMAGVQEAWTELVGRYHGKGMRIIRRQIGDPYLAEDIMQNLWSTLVSAVKRQPPDSFAALFHTLLKRRLIDELRRRGRTREAAILDATQTDREGEGRSLLEQQAAETPDPLEVAVRSDEERLLQQAMENLPDHYRRTIEARHLQGLSNRETARILVAEGLVPNEDGAEKRVENYYYRGLKELRRQLEALGYEHRGGTRT
ncbi:MAG: RNA polymerase sigma factor [Bacillota bacterium]